MHKRMIDHKSASVWSPFTGQVLDREEQDIENTDYVEAPDQVARMEEWKRAVENYKKKKSVTVRIDERTLNALKARALREGMPYQTLLTSVLHKYVQGRLKERD